jgi:hypothetical protein
MSATTDHFPRDPSGLPCVAATSELVELPAGQPSGLRIGSVAEQLAETAR